MSGLSANCPSCGGQVEFRIGSSFVTICEFCSTAVARTDRGLEDHGKVVDLIESASPLDLFLEGRYGDSRFQIVGRTQIRHGAGGVWDEWYCAFDSGHWGWLSEAQGRFYMSFASEGAQAPAFPRLAPGMELPGLAGGMVVAEIGTAQILGAKGEIPYLLEANKSYSYADLSGQGGAFGTLDYSDSPPTFYLGKEVTLDDIGIAASAPARDDAAEKAIAGPGLTAQALECPNCRGSLELIAPDQCERVACPYCGALSDVNQGKLNVLQILDKDRFPDPPIPLGAKGTINGEEMQVCGYMVRSTYDEGEAFYWDEYLLYNPRLGFRWFVDSDGHWCFVEPVNLADVDAGDYIARHEGTGYELVESGTGQVDFVQGQFYWNVEPGERVEMREYTAPPHTLSVECSPTEVTWSKSTYWPKNEVESCFGVELREPTAKSVALGQPYPHNGIFKLAAVLMALAVGFFFYTKSRASSTVVLTEAYEFPVSTEPGSQMFFSTPFMLKGGRNIEIEAYSPVDNSWVYLEMDLINEKTGAVTFFDLPVEMYRGSGWKEGSTRSKKVLKAVGSGEYTLRIAMQRKDSASIGRATIFVREGVVRLRYFLILLGFLAIFPLFTYLHKIGFERTRRGLSSVGGDSWEHDDDY